VDLGIKRDIWGFVQIMRESGDLWDKRDSPISVLISPIFQRIVIPDQD